MFYSPPIQLRLPATSANLGPGFDTVALAMELFLHLEASVADEYSIDASGRSSEVVASLRDNLLLNTYRDVAPSAPPLHLSVNNQIPHGMGCGSSAAAILGGIHLANHFSDLRLTPEQILSEACTREGHPDNVAACLHGGFTVSAMQGESVTTATFSNPTPSGEPWKLFLVLPADPLQTSKARALLPDRYSRVDAVANVQAVALLVSAFALGRPELLAAATSDRFHQPFRSDACPLLPALSPLMGYVGSRHGIYSVTLSGAGPAVLIIADPSRPEKPILNLIQQSAGTLVAEIIVTRIHSPAPQSPSRLVSNLMHLT